MSKNASPQNRPDGLLPLKCSFPDGIVHIAYYLVRGLHITVSCQDSFAATVSFWTHGYARACGVCIHFPPACAYDNAYSFWLRLLSLGVQEAVFFCVGMLLYDFYWRVD